jgi:hypothetical protein
MFRCVARLLCYHITKGEEAEGATDKIGIGKREARDIQERGKRCKCYLVGKGGTNKLPKRVSLRNLHRDPGYPGQNLCMMVL